MFGVWWKLKIYFFYKQELKYGQIRIAKKAKNKTRTFLANLFYENGGASEASADQSPHHPLFKITEVNYTNINIRRYFAIGIAVEIPE